MSNEAHHASNSEEQSSSEGSNCIISFSWNNGILGAVLYDLITMELTFVHEIIDTRPDFIYLNNLLRQVCPSYLLINGSSTFSNDILSLLNLPEDMYRSSKRRNKNKPSNSNILLENIDLRKLPAAKTRIMKLNLPGLPEDATENTKTYFITSVIPFDQTLVIYSFSTLLDYLETNFKHLFRHESLIITNINVCQLQNQLLIDLSTLYGLQIFSTSSNRNSKEGKKTFNMFNLLNQCVSSIGLNALKEIMMTPTRDVNELKIRQNTVEWCTISQNFETVSKFRRYLRKIRNVSLLCKRIIMYMGKASDIKLLKSSIYYAYLICELCAESCGSGRNDQTLLKLLANFTTQSRTIKGVLFSLDKVVDLVESEKENRFIVKTGLDMELDQKKELLITVEKSIYKPEHSKKLNLPKFVRDYYLIFMPGVGFVIAAEIENSIVDIDMEGICDIIFRKENTIYFKTNYCHELNNEYGDLYGDICCHEKRIFDRLVKYLTQTLPELIAINKMCAKLDCLIAFASVAVQRQYVKPEIVEERGLVIKAGRHPLIETKVHFIPNDTEISEVNKNLITILSAPNASGKSAYMKEIALIAYMTHIGSFVPADFVKMGVFDAIYTRMYCPESIHQEESSYFSDLKQMSNVLFRGTSKSLVLIDEFGKGTNIREGQALLAACIENISNRGQDASISIISTHFHDVLKLINKTDGIALKTIKTIQDEQGYRSLYEIVDGYCSPNISDYNETYAIFSQLMSCEREKFDIDQMYDNILAAKFGFAITLMNMYRKTKNLDMQEIFELFKKTHLS